MIGNMEGSAAEKLDQVASLFSTLVPQATCRLSRDGMKIVCQAARLDGELHVETMSVELLPTEIVRHAAMRLGKATLPRERLDNWQRWCSAWHVLQAHGPRALGHLDEQIRMLEADGEHEGAAHEQDLRRRISALLATPEAWKSSASI